MERERQRTEARFKDTDVRIVTFGLSWMMAFLE